MRDLGTVVRGIRTPIIKENDNLATIVVNSVLNASKNNHFEFFVDDIDQLRFTCCKVEVIEKTRKEYKASFYFTDYMKYLLEHPEFSIGSDHQVKLNLYNPDSSKSISLHKTPVTLKQKRFCCDTTNDSSTLTIELIFVESYKRVLNPIF